MKLWLRISVFIIILFIGCDAIESGCSHRVQLLWKIDSLGFHRNLYYNISFATSCQIDHCKLCLQQTLPSGLFVNKDQLQDFFRLGKLVSSVDGIVDVEAPADVSPQTIVRILNELNETSNNLFEGKTILPIHTRYHNPQSGGGFRTITIHKPDLYIHCNEELQMVKKEVFLTPCAGQESPLPFYKIGYDIVEEDEVLTLQVPVGDSDSLLLVQTATIFVTMIGCVYITGVLLKI